MINQRLFDHYDIDTTKDLAIGKTCGRPFDTILVDKMGSCYACECQAWLPQSVGNLLKNSMEDILMSPMRGHLQHSVSDGTYRYCNNKLCTYISKNKFPHGDLSAGLRQLRLAIDDSCNLSCPSCRKEKIFLYKGGTFKFRMRIMQRVLEFMRSRRDPLLVHIGSDGDPFASILYRTLMKNAPDRDCFSYSLQTNGLLFKQMYPRVRHVIGKAKHINVSIDGASKNTYETLRRGGDWHKIQQNLEFIGEKKSSGYRFELHMVVQKENWHEMPAMLELARRVGADEVKFTKLADWGTFDNFELQQPPEDNIEFMDMLERCESDPIGHTWLDPDSI
jgi:sulfatase maturation enzyme AslB (radical SAM superfamily)